MDWLSGASLAVACVAAIVAVWQGVIGRRQLKLAEQTEGRTEAALDEIRVLSRENKALAESIKNEIDQRITRLLDLRIDSERQSNEMSNQMAGEFMKQVFGGMADGVVPDPEAEESDTSDTDSNG